MKALGLLVVLSLAGCGSAMEVSGGGDVSASGCLPTSALTIAAGKYTQPGTGSATNVLILLDNGRWCADAMRDGATALKSEGTWSTALEDGGTGLVVTKTNSLYFNVVSCDGESVKSYRKSDGAFAGFIYARQDPSAFTCDGQ